MNTLDKRLAKTNEKMQQIEHQRILRENRDQEAKRKTDFRRAVIVGAIFTKHFPVVLGFTPHNTVEANDIEFAPLEKFIATLAETYNLFDEMDNNLPT